MLITIDTFWALLANNSPVIIAAILFFLYQIKQQNHELSLRRIDLYEKPRQDALADCAYKLARCAHSTDSSGCGFIQLPAAKAAPYVKEETRNIIYQAVEMLCSTEGVRSCDELNATEKQLITNAINAINKEMTSAYKG